MTNFLDTSIIEHLREAVDSSNLFSHDKNYSKREYNLISAVMDRLDTCIKYLNAHSEPPRTEEDFIVFLMFASMLIDAVKESFKQLRANYPYLENRNSSIPFDNNPQYYTHFRDICIKSKLNITEENCPSDDKFFEYFRSLSFAHPVETSRAKFLQDGETQYSPWVKVYNILVDFNKPSDSVGIRIYSNQTEDTYDFMFSFNTLKEYIKSRYILMEKITERIFTIIKEQENKWKERKVIRDLPSIEILRNIQSILAERHEEDMVEDLISYLSCTLSIDKNRQSVEKFRQALLNTISRLCDAIDDMEYEKADDVIKISHIRPKKSHEMCHYQLEKIFSYVIDYRTIEQAVEFSQGFAKKWVEIDVDNMQIEEIRLLVRTACYLEWQEQEESK